MPTIPQSDLPRPKSWDEFEDIVWNIYSREWHDPHAERNGRSGQRQHGVDIYGQPREMGGRYAGIQCKRFAEGRLTQQAVEREVAEAEDFSPPLAEYTIATTESRDAAVQEVVRQIDEERRQADKFRLYLVFWETLCDRLSDPGNADLLQKHYGDWLRRDSYTAPPPPDRNVVPEPGALPAREQRLLLMRLASLFGPEAIAHAPRAERVPVDGEVRVVVGLPALTRAVAEIDRLPEGARTPGVTASFDEITQLVNPAANPESVARRIQGSSWRIADRSETGCRLIAPASEAPTHLGELLAIRDGETWLLGVVRRMQRSQAEEVTVGVEIVARKLVRVLMRTWSAPADDGRAGAERPFFGLYIPAHSDNRQSAQRSLVGPDDKLAHGAMVELDTGSARYLVRFTQMLERQAGWSWALFSAVRKLSS